MTSRQQLKGDRAEREIAAQIADLTGWKVRRKLGVGRADDTGDLTGVPETTVQVKDWADTLRAIRDGLRDVEVQRANAGTTHAVNFVRCRGGLWIATQTLPMWATTIREAVG